MGAAERQDEPMLYHALEYLHAGLPVFPICSPLMGAHTHRNPDTRRDEPCTGDRVGKTPLVRWRGYQQQLPDEDDVRLWWKRWPQANIGLATGELSGVLVLDADGTEARKEVLRRGGLENTPTVWTGKVGGAHFHLKYPGGNVRNFARRLPGTDMRAQGGYVLMPPSVHASGAKYRWADGTRHLEHAPVPTWLTELLTTPSEPADGDLHDALDLEEILQGIPEGKRDDTLFRYACKLRHDNVPQARAEALLRMAARACKPPFDEDTAVGKVRRAFQEYEPAASPTIEEEPGGGYFSPPAGTRTFDDDLPIDDDRSPVGDDADGETAVSWQVFNAEEFLAIEYPPVEWRIESYLREKAIIFNFGPPGTIKTYVATDAAVAIASGGMFLGKFACQQGRVLIVQEDTLGSDYQSTYLRPMLQARGLSGADVRETLFIAPPADFSFDREDRLRDLCNWLETNRPDLLVIDSFYLMYSGKREDLITVMRLLKRIRNRFGCAIWVIDHNRKSQGKNSEGEDSMDRLINGREKSAAVDAVMEYRRVKGQDGAAFIDMLKLRGSRLPESVLVAYSDGVISIDGDKPETTQGATKTVYDWLCREGGSRTKDQIARGCDLSERSVHYAVGELLAAGLAQKAGKQGRKDTWIAVRRADAEPQRQPSIEFDEDELP